VSWPFLVPLLALFLGNDFFRKKYLNLTFQTSLFFVSLFSYSILIFPVIFDKIGDYIFIASGVAVLFAIAFFLFILFRIMPERFKLNLKPLLLSIGGIFVIFQIFYFTNIIPPAPLSLKESGIYHSLERIYGNSEWYAARYTEPVAHYKNYIYKVSVESAPLYLFFKDQSDIFHWIPGTPVYCYSSVFSPTNLDIPIFHRWSWLNKGTGKWIEMARLSFPIVGGLDGGYRGYSYMYIHNAGRWRVDVINEQGQVLGRREFTVVAVADPPKLETAYR